jgi:hypothetical protein
MRYFDNIDLKGSLSKEEIKFQLQNGSDRILTDFRLFGGDNVLKHHKSWLNYVETNNPKIKKLALRVYYAEGFWLRLDLFAAESMHSAKLTYNDMNLNLLETALKQEFTIVPNLHLSFQSRNIIYLNGYLDSKQYLRYWLENVQNLHQYSRIEMDQYIIKLIQDGVVIESEHNRYHKIMKTVKYQGLNVCPGFGIFYKWSLDEVIDLDKRGILLSEIEDKVVQAFSIVGGLNNKKGGSK